MARRMSTRAGMRSGEQLTSEDAFEATAGEKAEEFDETPFVETPFPKKCLRKRPLLDYSEPRV